MSCIKLHVKTMSMRTKHSNHSLEIGFFFSLSLWFIDERRALAFTDAQLKKSMSNTER